ncbi:MAG: hypothetical protein GXP50_12910 [Deltaproteobacteria bacterium]|nr:hypothetical protein [Deltaproteobacteria bacterium]
MGVQFEDLFEAFEFVAGGGFIEHRAFVHRETGETLFWSDDLEWMDEDPPEGVEEPDDLGPGWIEVPRPNELDLGRALVRRFVEAHIPDEARTVEGFFRRKGAYGRFKDFLHDRGLLETWYRFEEEAKRNALREWAEKEGLGPVGE